MSFRKLGVNIDHVATIRNARGENYPSPIKAAIFSEKSGADSITIHLREDRRHIKDSDLKILKKKLRIPLNLEMAPTNEMLKIALKYKPDYVCIVPEKRSEITTEGGLNLNKKKFYLKNLISKLKEKKIIVSLFINPSIDHAKKAKSLGADSIEIHTGKYCNLINQNKNGESEYKKIKVTAIYAKKASLRVNAGHGLTYKSAKKIAKIKHITEFNIGHFIISESIFIGLKKTIKKFKSIIKL